MSIPQPRPILNRIPGDLPKSAPEQHVENFDKLTRVQLLEIKQRQEKLLANKRQVSKLPDKGKRIRDFYEKVQKELSHRDEVEQAAELFSDLNIATNGQRKLANLEWTGQCEPTNGDVALDSDDEDEMNPLKIIARSTVKQKVVTHIPPEKSLITEEDLKEIESFKEENQKEAVVPAEIVEVDVKEKINLIRPKLEEKFIGNPSSINSSSASLDLDPHILYLFEKGDQLPQTERFKPYKTTKSNVHDPEKEILRKTGGKTWEVTAATPPFLQHPGTKLLSLQDSVEIQADYLEKMKKLREQQAEERLSAKAERLKSLPQAPPVEGVTKRNPNFLTFREVQKSYSSDSSESEAEHLDSDEGVRDEEEERGGVSYVVYK